MSSLNTINAMPIGTIVRINFFSNGDDTLSPTSTQGSVHAIDMVGIGIVVEVDHFDRYVRFFPWSSVESVNFDEPVSR